MISHLLLLAFIRYASAGDTPELQWDPETVSDCAGWYDNDGSSSCAHTLDVFGVEPVRG